MSPEAPAGYFSTFSILDPSNSAEGQARAQKRNRRVFVCIPCHKRKLRCDKASPCGRCVSSGTPADCIYQPFPSAAKSRPRAHSREQSQSQSQSQPPSQPPSQQSSQPSLSREQTRTPPAIGPRDRCRASYRPADGRATVYGSTHWANIASEFDEATPFVFGTDSRWEPRYRQLKNLKYLFPALSGANFPFSNLCSLASKNLRILDVLPPRHIVEALANNYLDTFETTHRLLHRRQFRDELAALWKGAAPLPEGWLAQLCMMLALGAVSAPHYLFDGTGRSAAGWIELFLDSAELSFGRSPYMMAPNLTTVRTLCMMAMARLAEIRASSPEQLTYLSAFVSRVAMSLQLHRSAGLFAGMPEFEAEMRRRVWVTVRLLDLDVAMRSGTSYLWLDQDAEPPLAANEDAFRRVPGGGWSVDGAKVAAARAREYTDGTFQIHAAELLPLLSEAINAVNSPTRPTLEYDKVLSWDAQIRQRLRDAERALTTGHFGGARRAARALLQFQLLEVMANRALLALHNTYAAVVERAGRYEQSRIAVMEGCLAILDVHQSWAAPPSRSPSVASDSSLLASAASSPAGEAAAAAAAAPGWLVDLCHDDFGTAIIYGALAFRRRDFEDGGSGPDDEFSPSRLACAAIQQAMYLVRDRACRSLSHFKEFLGLSIICTCMQALQNGEPLLAKVLAAADDVEQLVIAGKQDMIWTASAAGLDFSEPARVAQMETYMDLDLSAATFT